MRLSCPSCFHERPNLCLSLFNAASWNLGSFGPQYADVDITGGATVTMEAQTTGSYAGLLFYQDDDTPLSPPSNQTIAGGTSIDLTGALYFPKGYVNYTGGATTGSGSCTQIIAQTVTFSSVADMNINCSGSGMSPVTIYDSVTLVE